MHKNNKVLGRIPIAPGQEFKPNNHSILNRMKPEIIYMAKRDSRYRDREKARTDNLENRLRNLNNTSPSPKKPPSPKNLTRKRNPFLNSKDTFLNSQDIEELENVDKPYFGGKKRRKRKTKKHKKKQKTRKNRKKSKK